MTHPRSRQRIYEPSKTPGTFSTPDLPLAAFLATRGLALVRVSYADDRAYFEFADPESQTNDLKIAWFNAPERSYAERLRMLKGMLTRGGAA